jgi:hypothetical protein
MINSLNVVIPENFLFAAKQRKKIDLESSLFSFNKIRKLDSGFSPAASPGMTISGSNFDSQRLIKCQSL